MHEHEHLPMGSAEERALAGLLADPSRGTILVVRGPGALLGYAILGYGYSVEFHGVDAFVDELFVAEAHRGKGLGRRLLEAAEQSVRAAGVVALHLEVDHANPAARRLYESLGYRSHPRHLMTKWHA
ncbi:MAG: GNAT family N-acetyltransferase [Candidatus Thermoplasmatota archaeon]